MATKDVTARKRKAKQRERDQDALNIVLGNGAPGDVDEESGIVGYEEERLNPEPLRRWLRHRKVPAHLLDGSEGALSVEKQYLLFVIMAYGDWRAIKQRVFYRKNAKKKGLGPTLQKLKDFNDEIVNDLIEWEELPDPYTPGRVMDVISHLVDSELLDDCAVSHSRIKRLLGDVDKRLLEQAKALADWEELPPLNAPDRVNDARKRLIASGLLDRLGLDASDGHIEGRLAAAHRLLANELKPTLHNKR